MKVCLVAPVPPPYGGIANWTNLMKRYLADEKKGISLSVINTAPKTRITENRTWWDRIVVSGFRMMGQGQKVIELIKYSNIDMIHMTTSGSLSLIRDIYIMKRIKRKGVPITYHIRFGRVPFIAKENNFEWKCMCKALHLTDRIITLDEKTKEVILDKFPDKNVNYVPNPINMEELPAPTDDQEKTILFLGWVVKTKGIEELLSAWGNICSRYNEWNLKIVGPVEGQYMNFLKNNYCMDHVCFLGEKEHGEALDLLNKSALFVLPSYTEGFPNSVLEAMALKKPIIATDVGAVSDILSGECGLVVKPQDIDSLTQGLDRIMGSCELRKRLRENAYFKVKSKYDIGIIIQEYMRIWEGEKYEFSRKDN